MAFNIPGVPFKLTPQDMGAFDLGGAIKSGLSNANDIQEARFKPSTLAEQLLGKQLENKINTAKAKYADQLAAAQVQHQNALIEKAKRGNAAPAEIQTLEWLLKNKGRFNQGGNPNPTNEESSEEPTIPNVGEEQPSYVQSLPGVRPKPVETSNEPDWAKQIYEHHLRKAAGIAEPKKYAPSNTLKELTEQSDAEAGFIPGTDRKQKFPNEQSQKEFLDSLSAKTGSLKKGSHFVIGENGERIGESRPKTPKEREIDRGTVIFKQFAHIVNEGLNRYSGENSITNMENDARNYKTDPKARKRFDQLILAKQLATLTAVNEAARFGAGKTNQVFNQFRKSLSNYDIPSKIDSLITQYQIPASANIKNGLRFQQELDKADKKYKETAEPNVIEYYPGKAPVKKEDPNNPSTWAAGEGNIQDPNTGEWATVPVMEGEWDKFIKAGGKRHGG